MATFRCKITYLDGQSPFTVALIDATSEIEAKTLADQKYSPRVIRAECEELSEEDAEMFRYMEE
ncbi:hypothetical protein JWR97_25825, partial [Pseudomonas cedrina subsp. fulgida]|nr:hypothetical protein [Pseudomonas cedrina subsp. fulgida]